jgi:hypothetical protein
VRERAELELGFFVLKVVGGAGWVPDLFKHWTRGLNRHKRIGDFQLESAKIGIKIARVGSGLQIGRVFLHPY